MKRTSIITLLEYTPYDNKCPSPFGIRDSEKEEEKNFYENHLFVDYPHSSDKFRDDLSTYIEEPSIHLITFSGSSGSGKTTFLKDFFRKKGEEYHYVYINLVEYPSPLGNDETVATTLKDGLKFLLSKDVARSFYETFRVWVHKKSKVSLSYFLPAEQDRFMSFCESFSQEDSPLRFEVEMEKFSFYHNSDLTQLLSIYLIASIIPYKNDEDTPFVFVFDNLDEVGKQYLSSVLSTTISTAFSCAQVYCEQVLRYYFTKNVTFVQSVRMENQRYLRRASDLQERTNILHNNTRSLEFSQEYQATYSDILNARLRCYERMCVSDMSNDKNNKTSYDSLNKLIQSEEVFFKCFIKPLYSYDYRMYTHFAISDLLQERSVSIPEPLLSLNAENDCQQGARGMLLFYSLDGLLRYNMSRFSSYVKEEFSSDACNIFRMSFTLLSNLSGWTRREEGLMELLEDKDDFNERTKEVEMPKFLSAIESWYKTDEKKASLIPKVLEGLIGTSANSFECPILLFGNTIDEYIVSLGNDFSVESLAAKVVRDYNNNPTRLASITIQINPLCIVYSARVFIHYEYFNLISPYMLTSKNKKVDYIPQPLFRFVDFDEDTQHITKCLSYTFETAITIIKKADDHFCKTCKVRNNGLCSGNCKPFVDKFKKDGFSFNNTIHATRIISAHIHYLENYRYFLWHRIGKRDNHSDKEIEIQRIIIGQILEYINFYKDRKVKDDIYDSITKFWKSQYDNALETLNNQQQYLVVNLTIKRSKTESGTSIVTS